MARNTLYQATHSCGHDAQATAKEAAFAPFAAPRHVFVSAGSDFHERSPAAVLADWRRHIGAQPCAVCRRRERASATAKADAGAPYDNGLAAMIDAATADDREKRERELVQQLRCLPREEALSLARARLRSYRNRPLGGLKMCGDYADLLRARDEALVCAAFLGEDA